MWPTSPECSQPSASMVCAGLLRLVQVAHEHSGAANQDLSLAGDADLVAEHRLSDRAEPALVRRVQRDDRTALGLPVAFDDLQSHHHVPAQQLGRNRRGRRDQRARPLQAEAGLDVAEHRHLGQPAQRQQPCRHRLAGRAQIDHAAADLHRAFECPALQRRRVVQREANRRVELLPGARHPGNVVRRDFAQVLVEGVRTFDHVDHRAGAQRAIDRAEALRDVAQRQPAQQFVCRAGGQHVVDHFDQVQHVSMAEHHALRRSGGSGGVDQDRSVVRLGLLDLAFPAPGLGGVGRITVGNELLE